MALKKVNFKEDEEALFDNAVIYKRGEYWHMRMWLPKEHKYARYLGFTCGSEGGQYSQLSVDREDLDGYVSFDSGSWDASSGWVMDVLAKEVCKTAIEDEAKSHKPEKHTRFLGR